MPEPNASDVQAMRRDAEAQGYWVDAEEWAPGKWVATVRRLNIPWADTEESAIELALTDAGVYRRG